MSLMMFYYSILVLLRLVVNLESLFTLFLFAFLSLLDYMEVGLDLLSQSRFYIVIVFVSFFAYNSFSV